MQDRPVVLTVGVSDSMIDRMRTAAIVHGDFRLLEADCESEAVSILLDVSPNVVVVNLDLPYGSPLAVADYVSFRCPGARVLFEMGDGPGFADGSIFAHSFNAHGMVTPQMSMADVAAVVAHHATAVH